MFAKLREKSPLNTFFTDAEFLSCGKHFHQGIKKPQHVSGFLNIIKSLS